MEKEFVPYELALALKEIGFDEPCFAFFDTFQSNKLIFAIEGKNKMGVSINNKNFTIAPTWQQAFRWFREKQEIEGFVHKAIEGTYYFVIKRIGNNESNMYEFIKTPPKNVDTYEEAELSCLKKLIEIVENK